MNKDKLVWTMFQELTPPFKYFMMVTDGYVYSMSNFYPDVIDKMMRSGQLWDYMELSAEDLMVSLGYL